jgi:hypothetical protein
MSVEISRRRFLKLCVTSGSVAAIALTLGCTELEQNPRKLDGNAISGEGAKEYLTQNFADGAEIPLRTGPNMGSELSIDGHKVVGLEDYRVKAQPVYGVVYPSDDTEEGKFI